MDTRILSPTPNQSPQTMKVIITIDTTEKWLLHEVMALTGCRIELCFALAYEYEFEQRVNPMFIQQKYMRYLRTHENPPEIVQNWCIDILAGRIHSYEEETPFETLVEQGTTPS